MGKISIEGYEFIGEADFSLSADNTVDRVPGSDRSFVTDQGVNPLVISISGTCTPNTDSFSNVRTAIMTEGELDLILDTGWKYKVFRQSFRPSRPAGVKSSDLNDGVNFFDVTFVSEYPYQFDSTAKTRSKSITTNNQTWSADDSSNNIATFGEVNAVPTITVTASAVSASYTSDRHVIHDSDATEYDTDQQTYQLKKTFTYTADANRARHLTIVGADLKSAFAEDDNYVKVTYTAASLEGGAETTFTEMTHNTTSYVTHSYTGDILTAANEQLDVKFYIKNATEEATVYMKNLVCTVTERAKNGVEDVQIYNTADDSVICNVCNELLKGTVVSLSPSGAATLDFDDGFTDTDYLQDYYYMSGVTRDAGNNELDIADGGYLEYKIYTKYPIVGNPTLTSQINITNGTPTLQIANDSSGEPGTYYDIDTAIVDNVSTEYELVSGNDVSFNGETVIYFRFDCTGAGTVTLSIIDFELDVNMACIDAEFPEITNGGSANTFQCDQNSESALTLTALLTYEDRRWPG